MTKKQKCRDCKSSQIVTQEREALGVDSVMRKETEVECLACKAKYTL